MPSNRLNVIIGNRWIFPIEHCCRFLIFQDVFILDKSSKVTLKTLITLVNCTRTVVVVMIRLPLLHPCRHVDTPFRKKQSFPESIKRQCAEYSVKDYNEYFNCLLPKCHFVNVNFNFKLQFVSQISFHDSSSHTYRTCGVVCGTATATGCWYGTNLCLFLLHRIHPTTTAIKHTPPTIAPTISAIRTLSLIACNCSKSTVLLSNTSPSGYFTSTFTILVWCLKSRSDIQNGMSIVVGTKEPTVFSAMQFSVSDLISSQSPLGNSWYIVTLYREWSRDGTFNNVNDHHPSSLW